MFTNHDKILCYLASFLIPVIGVILFAVWIGNDHPDKKKVGIHSLYFSLASFLVVILLGVVSFYLFSTVTFEG